MVINCKVRDEPKPQVEIMKHPIEKPKMDVGTLAELLVDTKNIILPIHTASNSKKLHEAASDHNGQCYFKHKILSRSSRNYKNLQNIHKKSTHEVLSHFDVIWSNFTLSATE